VSFREVVESAKSHSEMEGVLFSLSEVLPLLVFNACKTGLLGTLEGIRRRVPSCVFNYAFEYAKRSTQQPNNMIYIICMLIVFVPRFWTILFKMLRPYLIIGIIYGINYGIHHYFHWW
jgi:hypothetical protein